MFNITMDNENTIIIIMKVNKITFNIGTTDVDARVI